jgi:phosphoribosylglycinamide formyltransferase 2
VLLLRAAASVAILAEGEGVPLFDGLEKALAVPESQLRLFAKPICTGKRRLAVAVAAGDDVELARRRAREVAAAVRIELR